MDGLPVDVWSEQGLDGKYLFEKQVASSAMAVVVVARHLELDERVAIKFLSPEAQRSGTAVSRFRREAKAAAKIKNQHVVRIIDVATTAAGIPYIVMEYLEGMDLERLLARYPEHQAPLADAVDFILQASEAVVEGHSIGIVHRDLKPSNLYCVDRGDGFPMIKVLDFGISKFTASAGEVERTDRHEILGSPRYMSPEQIQSARDVDHRTDIWSLGVILYEAIAGRAPFNEDLIPELWRKILHESPAPLPALRRDCSVELWEVVAKCLHKDPSNRFADLGELAQALAPMSPERSRDSIARIRWSAGADTLAASRPSLFPDSYDRATTNPRRNRYRWLIAGSIASTVGIGLSLATLRKPSESRDSGPPVSERRPELRAEDPKQPPTAQPSDDTNVIHAMSATTGTLAAPSTSKVPLPVPRLKPAPSAEVAPRRLQVPRPTALPPKASNAPPISSASPSSTPGIEHQTNNTVWPMPPVTERK